MKKKRYLGIEGKPCTATRAIDALRGDEEQKEERNRYWASNSATLDYLVSYDPHGSYGKPILLSPRPVHKGVKTVWNIIS